MDLDVIAVTSFAAGPSGLRSKLGAGKIVVKPSYPQKPGPSEGIYPPRLHKQSLGAVAADRVEHKVRAAVAGQHQFAGDQRSADDGQGEGDHAGRTRLWATKDPE